jgi:hypothetical protein
VTGAPEVLAPDEVRVSLGSSARSRIAQRMR